MFTVFGRNRQTEYVSIVELLMALGYLVAVPYYMSMLN